MKKHDAVLALLVAVIWGMGFVVAKAGMSHFSPILLMALRFALTAICLVWFYRPPIALFKDLFWIALVSAAIQYSLTFTGVQGIDASTSALLVQLEVPFGLLLAWWVFGDKLSVKQGIGVLVAFSGALLIVGKPSLSNDVLSMFLVIAGAFTWAVGQVMIQKLGKLGGLRLISCVAVFATPQLFIASFLFESNQFEQIQTASISEWGAVIYLGLVMTAFAYALWYRLIGLYSVNQVIPFLLLLPVTTVLGGVFFLGEVLTTNTIIGGFLAVSGVAIITIKRHAMK